MAEKNARTGVKLLVTTTYVLMVTVNTLANALPINGVATGEVSERYPNLFTPTGFTFSIWGVIYLFLGLHVLYQWGLFSRKEARKEALLNQIGILFSLSSMVNTGWIFAWHYEFIGISLLLIIALLVLLVSIMEALRKEDLTVQEEIFLRLPFSIYFGWITVATVANTTAWLVSIEWGRFGIPEPVWAAATIILAAMIGTAVTVRNRDVAYGAVLVWAFAGILFKHLSAGGFNGDYPIVIWTIGVCLAVFAVALVTALLRRGSVPRHHA